MIVRHVALFGLLLATRASAQTDYYNTGSGRPLRVEDAVPVEYRGVELGFAPLRFERGRDRVNRWSLTPQIAVGVLPRTELHVALPVEYVDLDAPASRGVAGIEISALHALNAETSIPAIAVGADVLLPAGPLGGDATYASFKAVATRTFRWARLHANGAFAVGPTARDVGVDEPRPENPEVSRWWAGLAIDKTFPLQSVLISAETFADKGVRADADVEWHAGVGARYQLTPRWAIDGGTGRRLTGEDRAWYVTVGWAYAMGIP